MKKSLLVSGGSGFLGKQLVPLLKNHFEVDILSRSSGYQVQGDLIKINAGLTRIEDYKSKYIGFVHLAGLYDLEASRSACFLNNVVATTNALKLTEDLGIPFFFNTSSVAAAINIQDKTVQPAQLNTSKKFPDFYSESKALAEELVQNFNSSSVSRINFRPGVLVGTSADGEIDRIDGPYKAPEAFNRMIKIFANLPGPLILPGSSETRLPLVPVDKCAEAMAAIIRTTIESPREKYQSYHLVPNEGLGLEQFYKSVMRHLLIPNRRIILTNQIPDALLKFAAKWLLGFPEAQFNYLIGFPKYEVSQTTALIGSHWCPEFAEYEKNFWNGYEKYISNR